VGSWLHQPTIKILEIGITLTWVLQQGRLIRRPFAFIPFEMAEIEIGKATSPFNCTTFSHVERKRSTLHARGHGDRSELQKLKVATKIFRGTSRFWLHLLEKKGGKKVDLWTTTIYICTLVIDNQLTSTIKWVVQK